MEKIKVTGYKSLQGINLELRSINILIGANGAGKSNFISFFEFLNNLYEQKLQEYVALNGGMEKMLFQGSKVTDTIYTKLFFNEARYTYSFTLRAGTDNFLVAHESLDVAESDDWSGGFMVREAQVKYGIPDDREYLRKHLQSLRKYHFNDTGKRSPFNQLSHTENEVHSLYEDGRNIAAFLYEINRRHPKVYARIVKVIRSVAPYFGDFKFYPNEAGQVKLQWQDKYSTTDYGPNDFSDGTIRFVALAALFMQPDPPSHIIIDEPELGLHPVAIAKLAAMIQSVSERGTQVICATQSAEFISYFTPEEVITVDQQNGNSVFKRLNKEDLKQWLEDYSLGELWQRNIIAGGQP